ncbi:MAG: DUF1311 domain-containing protein [Roseibium sp.]|uniref:lysozyme inhibitor LprI family protein n=1 Tax=Roseibium sp. TaxID=1936156 RepID=UPI0026209DAD|nr:lysozyme inhibitor LprI family protein [Roseibium sp.]MCV0425511.1 DUF1311 domain-containing protein [Roseibium sp.]
MQARIGTLTLAVMALHVFGAQAQEAPPAECLNAQTQTDLNICSYKAYQNADKALNEAYKAAVSEATSLWGSPDKLRDAQRAWITYRDKACEVYNYPDGGSIQPLLINECMLKITKDRTHDLKTFAAGLGN